MKRVAAALTCACLTACGGSPGAIAPQRPNQPNTAFATVTATIVVPGSSAVPNVKLRRIFSQAASTQGVLFTVYPHGSTPSSAISATADDISTTAPAGTCTPTTNGGRTCTVSFQAPAGTTSNDLLVQTYDAKPSGPSTISGNPLSAAVVSPLALTPGVANPSVRFTLDPVLGSVNIVVTPSILHEMAPATFNVVANGLDKDGNVIVGSFVDSNGAAVSVPIGVPNTTNPGNSFSLSTSTVAASGTVITGTYDGTANTAAGGAQYSVGVQTTGTYAATGALALVSPTASATNLSAFFTPAAFTVDGMNYASVSGVDHLYMLVFSTATGSTNLGDYDLDSDTYTANAATIPPSNLGQGGVLQPTSGGTIYSGSQAAGFTYAAPPIGPTPLPCNSGPCSSAPIASEIATDGTANIYYGTGPNVVQYNTSSITAATLFAMSGATTYAVTGVAADQSGFIWAANSGSPQQLYVYDSSKGQAYSPSGSYSSFFSIAADAAGGSSKVFVSDPTDKEILSFGYSSTSGISTGTSYLMRSGTPEYVFQPASDDSGLWFDETLASPGGVVLGRIDKATGKVSEVDVVANGGSAGPIWGWPDAHAFYIIHYESGNLAELLKVTP